MTQIMYHLTHAAHLLLAAKKEIGQALRFARARRLPRKFITALIANIQTTADTRTKICNTITIVQAEIKEQEA